MDDSTTHRQEVQLGKYGPLFAVIGIVCIVLTWINGFQSPTEWTSMLHSYLFAVVLFMSVTLGCFGLMLLQHVLQGKWGLPILRIFEAGGGLSMFVLMAVFFIPIGMYAHQLYPWANPAWMNADPLLKHKEPYLNWGFIGIRFAIYFLIWGGYAWLMRRSVRKQESDGRFTHQKNRAKYCPPGIVLLFLTVTFAYTDWVIALDAHWWSTMYAFWFVSGMALGAVSIAAAISCLNADKPPYSNFVNKNWTRDIGNLMFTFTMLWGYTNLGQYLIIWHGNLPETTTYLVNRSIGHWSYLGFILVIGQFFVPFFALLSPTVKATPRLLAFVAIWILLMRVVDHFDVVEPFFRAEMAIKPADILALLGVGGLWAAVFSWNIRQAPLFPTYDPRILEVEHAH